MTSKSTLASISSYFASLLNQYCELQHHAGQVDTYRIVEIKEKRDGRTEFTIQIIGKNVVFKTHPEEIAGDDKMLEHFSKQDVRTITYFATQELKKPKYKILVKEFCAAFNKMIFKIKKHRGEEVLQKTADQISQDKNVIKELSAEEAHLIGYTTASEKATIDQQNQQKIHDKKIPKHKIIQQEYSETYDTTIYTLEEKQTKKRKQRTAIEISKDKKIIKGLNQEEAYKVGYDSKNT